MAGLSPVQVAWTCPGGWEAHEAHLDLNDECPWCGACPCEDCEAQS
jgi:hypothetical protein